MKSYKNIWPNVIDEDMAIQAIIDGTRFKRDQRAVQWLLYSEDEVKKDPNKWHMVDPEKARIYARFLIAHLQQRKWRHKAPRHKRQYCRNRASSKGKWRDLYIPCLDDHIVAHMVMQASMDVFTRGMHPHCCGSVPDRGIKHVNHYVEKWMQNDRACRYFVKLDIKKFFDNIDKDILLSLLRNKIRDERVMRIFEEIINSAPVAVPVGYYTSPWLANFYLQELDWMIEQGLYKERRGKRIKYARHYLRYVDDLLLIGTSKKDLEIAIREIKRYLETERHVTIKNNWEIKAIGKHVLIDGEWKLKPNTFWCDIGGYKFCKDATILRDGIFLATRRLAKDMAASGYYTPHQCQSINSRLGWSEHCNSNNFVRNEIRPYIDIQTTRRIVSECGQKARTANP